MALVSSLLVVGALIAFAADGQGPVDPGPIQLKDSNLGTYWYGAQIDKRELIGKVVLFEIWGS